MKLIPLSQGGWKHKDKYFAQVDDEDYEWLMQWKWCIAHSTNSDMLYAVRIEYGDNKKTTIKMHRQILGVTDPKIKVDHKYFDGLNNQKSNLRLATTSQNALNRRKNKGQYSSLFKGVTYSNAARTKNRWKASIKINNIHIHLGSFTYEIDAAHAYDEMAKILCEGFANLNFQ